MSSVTYRYIHCDGDTCDRDDVDVFEEDTFASARRDLRKLGWVRIYRQNKDYCPMCVEEQKEEEDDNA